MREREQEGMNRDRAREDERGSVRERMIQGRKLLLWRQREREGERGERERERGEKEKRDVERERGERERERGVKGKERDVMW